MGLVRGQTQGHGRFARWRLEADGAGPQERSIGHADRTVHIFGNFGSGTLTLQGSNDPAETVWNTLHDLSGAEIVVTAATILMIAENPQAIRPSLSGSTNPDLNINILSRSPK